MLFFEEKYKIDQSKVIDFNGNFDQQNTSLISDKLASNLQFLNEKKRINIVSYTIELLSIYQRNSINIYRNNCKFLMAYNIEQICLYSSGIISELASKGFATALDEINESITDKQKLQQLYREKLGNFSIDDRSGLGLLGIARRIGNPLLYNFEDFEDNYSNFELIVIINI
jgi:hypothetical protein